MDSKDRLPFWLLVALTLLLIWSVINPKEYGTWLMEVAPALIGIGVMLFTYRRFRLSNLSYVLIFIHCSILIIGGHYTYAETPLGFWMEQWFGWTRNNYDKIGHFAQGFIPAIVAREILLRKNVLKRGKWLSFIVVSICLAISAVYELIEWLAAVIGGEGADAFLGAQGYVWDTQTDMALALVGAIVALILLSKMHDRSMRQG